MIIKLNRKVIQTLVLVACINFTSCVKDGGLTPRVLEGKWELKSLNGQAGYNITWEFEDDGDFKFQYDSYTYLGSWEWNTDKTEIDIEYNIDGDRYIGEFEIEVLDKETLRGDFIEDGYTLDLEFERD